METPDVKEPSKIPPNSAFRHKSLKIIYHLNPALVYLEFFSLVIINRKTRIEIPLQQARRQATCLKLSTDRRNKRMAVVVIQNN